LSYWDQVRLIARRFHVEVCEFGEDKQLPGANAETLLLRAERLTGIRRKGYRHDHPLLRGALARLERNTIIFDSGVEPWLSLYNQAHEYAHIKLGHGPRFCRETDIDCEATEDKLPLGVHRVEGYGPQEKTECEANVFAREFLLPCDILGSWFIENRLNAEDIAKRVGVSIEMVCHQLARSLLTPEIRAGKDNELPAADLTLDESQKRAAEAAEGPLLTTAGPGTGKTRTLAGRVIHLLKLGVLPESVLILTFSNKAAAELRDRVKLVAPDQAQRIRIETFHSFGLELLRKYGANIGLPPKPVIIDPVDAMFLLEESLPDLALDYYENLPEPTMYLNDILKAISRAKDENVDPTRYEELARGMLTAAASDEEVAAAEKALEVARVYSFYQGNLIDNGLLDFGDLLCRSIELLKTHSAVKNDVRETYPHVLVDEYQDVNRASGLLLKEVVGEGGGLWAVGDIRQSIHRWRGATTANIRLFSEDFPKAKPSLSLEVNYRSQPPIVDAFSELVPSMHATTGETFRPWQKDRANSGGTLKYEIASDERAEAQGIAREIKSNFASGIPYRKQAVICRSHTSLARIARGLEEENVPVLYLGDFFERPEVRDMLSLLSLACEPHGSGLVRVARFPEYEIPLADVLALRRYASEKNRPFPGALSLASEADEISAQGKEKLALLAEQLDGLCYGRSAWNTLTRYLFVRSDYLATVLADESVAGQQRRLALYQLVQFVHSHLGRPVKTGVDPKRDLLRYIRRLEAYGDERQLRQVPAWADGIDAVRVLTIHAAKGLEFEAVYLPVLAKTYLPINRGYNPCPPPVGLLPSNVDDWYLEEEQCLFFVALSRARDHLCLTRAKRYGQANRNPSDFLSLIHRSLPRPVDANVSWSGALVPSVTVDVQPRAPAVRQVFDLRRLEVYMRCPRSYFYEFELGLSGKRDDSSYVKFHECVYEVVRWIQSERLEGRSPNDEAAMAKLDTIWTNNGPRGHYYEPRYRARAEEMVGNVMRQEPSPDSRPGKAECEVKLDYGGVTFTIDFIEERGNGSSPSVVVQRHRTGKPTKKEEDKPIYGLYQAAMQQAYPDAQKGLQIFYLSTREVKDLVLSQQKIVTRLRKYDEAMLGILKSDYGPKPDDRQCPRCPHYFICPIAEDSAKPGN
jgi:superfamily I DNA/RNA helicase/Zn-dependent peptidase ImmA (M78 family)